MSCYISPRALLEPLWTLTTKLFSETVLFSLFAASAHSLPTSADWNVLNATVHGSLVRILPLAHPCHLATYDLAACTAIKANYTNEFFRSTQISAMFDTLWEQLNGEWCIIGNLSDTSPIDAPCEQGNVPTYGVEATTVADIQIAVTFASIHGIELRVKGTGHDLSGRSTGANALLIWTHNLQSIETGQTTICGETLDAITVGAGVEWGAAYQALSDIGRTTAGGGDDGVGASGGQVQGGGHSPLANTYGLTTDQVVAFTVVTMDGTTRTVNKCQNTDLFWALRGGGGGTYAIVTSTTFRTYEDVTTAVAVVVVSVDPDAASMASAINEFAQASPALAQLGWTGSFAAFTGILEGSFFLPLIDGKTFEAANASWQPFFSSLTTQPGLTPVQTFVITVPSFFDAKTQFLIPQPAGTAGSLGSRLIPKALLQQNATRQNIVSLMGSLVKPSPIPLVIEFAGGGASSRFNNSAVLPAWRTALWHVIVSEFLSEGATETEIESALTSVTHTEVDPLRALTPGSGAYLGEADPAGPTWKEDFYGINYRPLLDIKRKYDPKLLLRCNRCVGSDLP